MKKFKNKTLFIYFGIIVKYYKFIVLTILILILLSLISFCYPMAISKIIDNGYMNKDISVIKFTTLILFILLLSEQILVLLRYYVSIFIKKKIQQDLMSIIYEKLMKMNYTFFNKYNDAGLVKMFSTDIQTFSMIFDSVIIRFISNILRITIGIIGLLNINKKMLIWVAFFIPLKLVIVFTLSKKKKIYVSKYIKSDIEFTSKFNNLVRCIREIKLWNIYSDTKNIFLVYLENMLNDQKNSEMVDTYNMFLEGALNTLLISVLYLSGGYLVCDGTLSLGSIIAFLSYALYVTEPISNIINVKYMASSIMPSVNRLQEFMDSEETEEEISNSNLLTFTNIQFNNVSFIFPTKKILQNISFDIQYGDKIAIIGENGCGKTTIINLLLRFLYPQKGEILLNGFNIKNYNINQYRSLYAVVSQNVILIEDSLRNNITMYQKYNDTEIMEVCEKCCLLNFIDTLPDKLDTLITNDGAKISGGEKQKIALARALIKNSEIIILDEATSNYDVESVEEVKKIVLSSFSDKTVIMVTHDYSLLDEKIKILRLNDKGLNPIN